MQRLSFDPKPLFGNPAILGSEDLRIYCELAVLGVKNYPKYYEDILKRIPIMAGINLPAFNILDILSLEVQYYGKERINSWGYRKSLMPLPEDPYFGDTLNNQYELSNWKWGLYAKKTLFNTFDIVAYIGRDHSFIFNNDPSFLDRSEAMPGKTVIRTPTTVNGNTVTDIEKKRHWMWMVKTAAHF
jgi:hypothetical protein